LQKTGHIFPQVIHVERLLVIKFILENCGHLVGYNGSSFITSNRMKSAPNSEIVKKYFVETGVESIKLEASKMKLHDELFLTLASMNDLLSFSALQAAFDIRKLLINKHQNLDRSLDKILGI